MSVSSRKHLLMLLLFFLPITFLFLLLGTWQWGRAEEKQALLARVEHDQFYPISLAELQRGAPALEYRHIQLHGFYRPQYSFFLINQFNEHQLGRHVITPFVLDSGEVILVDRGWVSSADPLVLSSTREATLVTGRLRLLRKTHFVPAASEQQSSAVPLELIQLDRVWLERHWQTSLLPFVLLLDADQPEGYVREWVVTRISPERHRAYAVQWFALAGVSIIMLTILLKKVKTS